MEQAFGCPEGGQESVGRQLRNDEKTAALKKFEVLRLTP